MGSRLTGRRQGHRKDGPAPRKEARVGQGWAHRLRAHDGVSSLYGGSIMYMDLLTAWRGQALMQCLCWLDCCANLS